MAKTTRKIFLCTSTEAKTVEALEAVRKWAISADEKVLSKTLRMEKKAGPKRT